MKNQYFGDINDYRKYGLLRAIVRCSRLRLLVAWMLTPDDGSTDGKFISYLENPAKWAHHDPILFQGLKGLVDSARQRVVSMIESSELLGQAGYFSLIVPDAATERSQWFKSLEEEVKLYDFVFLDPDNGLEVKSRPYGAKNSSKFLYWREVEALWSSGKSLLIYQHFVREKRVTFIQRMLEALKSATPESFVEAFSTPHVMFLMALQPKHHSLHAEIVEAVQERWAGQIQHWELIRAQRVRTTRVSEANHGCWRGSPWRRPAPGCRRS